MIKMSSLSGSSPMKAGPVVPKRVLQRDTFSVPLNSRVGSGTVPPLPHSRGPRQGRPLVKVLSDHSTNATCSETSHHSIKSFDYKTSEMDRPLLSNISFSSDESEHKYLNEPITADNSNLESADPRSLLADDFDRLPSGSAGDRPRRPPIASKSTEEERLPKRRVFNNRPPVSSRARYYESRTDEKKPQANEDDDEEEDYYFSFERMRYKFQDEYHIGVTDRELFVFFDMDRVVKIRKQSRFFNNHIHFDTDEVIDAVRMDDFYGDSPRFHKLKRMGRFALYDLNANYGCKPNTTTMEFGCTFYEWEKAKLNLSKKRANKTGLIPPKVVLSAVHSTFYDNPEWYSYFEQLLHDSCKYNIIDPLLSTYDSMSLQKLRRLDVYGAATESMAGNLIRDATREIEGGVQAIKTVLSTSPATETVKNAVLKSVAVSLNGVQRLRNYAMGPPHKPVGEIVGKSRELAVNNTVSLKPGSRILVANSDEDAKERDIIALTPFIPVKACLPTDSVENMVNALLHRQMKERPDMDASGKAVFDQMASRIAKGYTAADELKTEEEHFATRKGWSKSKKNRYSDEYDGTTAYLGYSNRLKVVKTTRNVFTKKEPVLCPPTKAARCISASTSDIQMYYGRMFWQVKNEMVKQTRHKNVVNVCGYNRQDIGLIMQDLTSYVAGKNFDSVSEGEVYYVTGDFSSFDSTVNPNHISAEEKICIKILPQHRSDLQDYMKRNKEDWIAQGTLMGSFCQAKVTASRASGDPDTTAGNTLIANVAVHCIASDLGCRSMHTGSQTCENTPHKLSKNRYAAMICGDDVLFIFGRNTGEEVTKKPNLIPTLAKKYGFVFKTEDPVTDPSLCEFLSGTFMRGIVNGKLQYVHVAKFSRLLTKLPLSVKSNMSSKELLKLQIEKMMALTEEIWYVPEFQRKIEVVLNILKTIYGKKVKWQNREFVEDRVRGGGPKAQACEETGHDLDSRYPLLRQLDTQLESILNAYRVENKRLVVREIEAGTDWSEVFNRDGIEWDLDLSDRNDS